MKPDPQLELGTELDFFESELEALRRDFVGDKFGAEAFLIRRVAATEEAAGDVCPALTLGVLDAHP
jgi:hypothetical protein